MRLQRISKIKASKRESKSWKKELIQNLVCTSSVRVSLYSRPSKETSSRKSDLGVTLASNNCLFQRMNRNQIKPKRRFWFQHNGLLRSQGISLVFVVCFHCRMFKMSWMETATSEVNSIAPELIWFYNPMKKKRATRRKRRARTRRRRYPIDPSACENQRSRVPLILLWDKRLSTNDYINEHWSRRRFQCWIILRCFLYLVTVNSGKCGLSRLLGTNMPSKCRRRKTRM
mmetsp:Transcript_26522/g.64639  ORF Transcript_26522/g.64639 Transcript_26522/m.64639 type:complete len:229 (+) Transcript_26522:2787-3473(+)